MLWKLHKGQWQIQDSPDEGGANPCVWPENLLFGKIFTENCMKMKEIEPRRGARPWHPLDAAMKKAIARSRRAYVTWSEREWVSQHFGTKRQKQPLGWL